MYMYVCMYVYVYMNKVYVYTYKGFPGGASGKKPICQCRKHERLGFDPWVRKIPWRRAWQPASVFLPGESHGQESLVGYIPQDHKETQLKRLSMHMHVLMNKYMYI